MSGGGPEGGNDAAGQRPEEAGTCPFRVMRGMAGARALLRSRGASLQAGFTAEKIPEGLFTRRPLLIADDPDHDRRRRELGRFFSPRAVRTQYAEHIQQTARRAVASVAERPFDLDTLALHYSVAVTARVVGLREDRIRGTSRRLERFFTQPPADYSQSDYGRSRAQWALAGWRGLLAVAGFWWGDVRPAIRDHRRTLREDPIGCLMAQGATRREILAEAMTYATAGMVTTREFIAMAAWRLLQDRSLRMRYRQDDVQGKDAILREILRAEPVVGHLYRRLREDLASENEGLLPAGTLVDLDVRAVNRDPDFAGAEPDRIRADRGLGPQAAGLSFGAGIHQCPGEHLALAETRALLDALLEQGLRLVAEPERSTDSVIAGYRLRGLRVRLERPCAVPSDFPDPDRE